MAYGLLPGGVLEWDAFAGVGDLLRTIIYRRPAGGAEADWYYLGETTDETFTDHEASSGDEYDYGVAFEVLLFGEVLEGDKAVVSGSMRHRGLSIHEAGELDNYALVNAEAYEITPEQEVAYVLGRRRQAPTPQYGEREAARVRVTPGPESVFASQDWEALMAMFSRQRTMGATYVVRPATGGVWFTNIANLSRQDAQTLRRLGLEFQEIHYDRTSA